MNRPFKIWVEDNEMTKSDLKDWMVVKTREGSNYMVDNTHNILVSNDGWMPLDQYSNDLLCITDNDFDIVAVYEVTRPFAVRFYMKGVCDMKGVYGDSCLQTIWERKEHPTEMTVAEIEEKLGIKNLKIIKEK